MRTNYKIGELLRRLGVKDAAGALDVLETIQPVLSLGDVDGIASPLLPALAWVGAELPSSGANRQAIQITSRAPGGTLIRSMNLAGTAQVYHFTLSPAGLATGTMNARALVQMTQPGANPVVTQALDGPNPNQLTNLFPSIAIGVASFEILSEIIYIPPGFSFYMESAAGAVTLNYAILLQDIDEGAPQP